MSQEKPKAQEILRVVRNPQTGEQAIKIAGRQFKSLDEINHPKAQNIILEAVGNLVDAVGGYDVLVEAGVAPLIAQPEPIADPDDGMEDVAPTDAVETDPQPQEPIVDTTQARFLSTLRDSAVEVDEGTGNSKTSFWGSLRGGKQKQNSVEPLPVLNIGQQINLIVQRKLSSEEQLKGRHIHITNDEFGGIEINIDGRVHDDVAQVEDPLVRMLIKLAIKEWEESRG